MIYLDNAATTKPSRRVQKLATELMENKWMNPSSLYCEALKNEINEARKTISKLTGYKYITFTSGATEGNNTILNQHWDTVITTRIEHDSVYNTIERNGAYIKFLKVDPNGEIDSECLKKYLSEANDKDKILVSIIAVNNEIGTIQPIKRIGEIVHDRPNTYLHVDCTQCMGKLKSELYNSADYITASAHKFHGLKGVGFIGSKNTITPFISGGHQESGRRAGTENVIGILTMAEALKECYDNMQKRFDSASKLQYLIVNELYSIGDTRFNSDPFNPFIISVSFKGVNAESLLYLLSMKEIYVSSGSACNSDSHKVSRVLKEIGVPEDYINGTIRISLNGTESYTEVLSACDIIKDEVKLIRGACK